MYANQPYSQDIQPYPENIQYYQYMTAMTLDQQCTPQLWPSYNQQYPSNYNEIGNNNEDQYSSNIKPSFARSIINEIIKQPQLFMKYSPLWMGGVCLINYL